MKQIAKKITEYVKKSKRAKLYGVFGLIYLIAVIFVMNDAWLYQTPIAKLTKVETSVAGESKSTRGTQEIKYKQKIRGVILNGTNKGKIVDFSNEYTYTGMLKQKYHKGDKVLLNGSENNVGSSIQCVKRDTELVILLGCEREYKDNKLEAWVNRHNDHKEYNSAVRKEFDGCKNVTLFDVNEYITSDDDFNDSVNHYKKRVYYLMAQKFTEMINAHANADVAKQTSKAKLAYLTLKQKIKKIVKPNG